MAAIRCTENGEERTFERHLRVGRSDGNDLVVRRDTVSTYHAAVEWRADGFYVRDLGSRNGTALDGVRVTDWARLTEGATLRFGPDSAWTVQSVSPPSNATDKAPLAVLSADGVRHPVGEDRFTFGRGEGFDLALPGRDGALVATLFIENDACRLLATEDGDVSLRGEPLAAGEPAAAAPNDAFEVGGSVWRLAVRAGLERTATVDASLRTRKYGSFRLELTQRAEFGDIVVRDGARVARFTEQEMRFSLLWVLSEALTSAESDDGWVHDMVLRTGIWGRRAAENQAMSTLAKLIHDTRTMLGRQGIDGLFIEKRRGRTRLRLDPSQVTLR